MTEKITQYLNIFRDDEVFNKFRSKKHVIEEFKFYDKSVTREYIATIQLELGTHQGHKDSISITEKSFLEDGLREYKIEEIKTLENDIKSLEKHLKKLKGEV